MFPQVSLPQSKLQAVYGRPGKDPPHTHQTVSHQCGQGVPGKAPGIQKICGHPSSQGQMRCAGEEGPGAGGVPCLFSILPLPHLAQPGP